MNINKWIEKVSKEPIESCCCERYKVCGFVTMSDGRKAEIKISLNLDEDEWN